MKKATLSVLLITLLTTAYAQETFSPQEQAAVEAILSKVNTPTPAKNSEEKIILPAENHQVALQEVNEEISEPEEEKPTGKQKCLTVAFVDIDEVFNAHPRTVAVKEQIRQKILSKEEEVENAKELIHVLHLENAHLINQLRELKPFYERIVVEPHALLPRPHEDADMLVFGNLLNRLTFAGAEQVTTSPLNTPARLEDLKERIGNNKRTIEEREFFIDNYKYTTREEILKLEKQEVNEILKDIYTEIKTFAKKRNIGAVVRKDEVLYGEHPVNVTKDFINRLKKSKKYRKRGN